MSFSVYDFRRDIRNLDITPEIRSRFMTLGPHEAAGRHSHDLGYEIFLVLEGEAEFEIDGDVATLGPGQLCFARPDQMHRVRNVGDTPMTLYLSVTPHIEPTHTFWDEGGAKLPPRYGGATASEFGAGGALAAPVPAPALLAREAAAFTALAESVAAVAARHAETLAAIERSLTAAGSPGEPTGAATRGATAQAVDALWALLFPVYRDVARLGAAWNDLAGRLAGPGAWSR